MRPTCKKFHIHVQRGKKGKRRRKAQNKTPKEAQESLNATERKLKPFLLALIHSLCQYLLVCKASFSCSLFSRPCVIHSKSAMKGLLLGAGNVGILAHLPSSFSFPVVLGVCPLCKMSRYQIPSKKPYLKRGKKGQE